MAAQTTALDTRRNINTNTTPGADGEGSLTITTNSSTGGIGSGASSLLDSSDILPLSPSSTSPHSTSSDKLLTPPLSSQNSSSIGLSSTSDFTSPRGAATSSGKVVQKETVAPDPNSSLITIQMKISRIFQRFLVRSPHAFVAMAGVFFTLYYGFGREVMAYSATTFVGVGSLVYCLTRAIFLEVIPNWMLPKNGDTRKWRHLMNVTYTAFITIIFTSAVWKLPELSEAQGLFFLTVSFGVPYSFLAQFYPDIDRQPTYFQQKHD